MIEPTTNVTIAAAAPMPTWRAPEKSDAAPGQQADAGADQRTAPRGSGRG